MDLPGTVPPDEKQLGAASRQLLRTLIMQHSNVLEWDDTPGPTKMFLLFEAPEGGLSAAPDGFVPKRAFYINLRKAFQVLGALIPNNCLCLLLQQPRSMMQPQCCVVFA
eukprot:GHUV01019719.1.p4 GENE.GHUV01019719.1~~GHUV01019719.1.p4  ORF type:complete len:109 (+),score=40.21 GHUV01019719.1:1377-1703(+)